MKTSTIEPSAVETAEKSQVTTLRAVTVSQPLATLLACGATRVLTLPEPTRHRGAIAIHAADTIDDRALAICREEAVAQALASAGYERPGALPRGAIVGVAAVSSCLPLGTGSPALSRMLESEALESGIHQIGEDGIAWLIEGARRVVPAQACSGGEGAWPLPAALAAVLAPAMERCVDPVRDRRLGAAV